jgi:hypothetical protein
MNEHYTQGVIDERDELAIKTTNLTAFIGSSVYQSLPEGERKRIDLQERYMMGYLSTLNDRIAEFW